MSRRIALLAGLALLLGPAAMTVQATHQAACSGVAPLTGCDPGSVHYDNGDTPSVEVCARPAPDCHRHLLEPYHGAGFTGSITVDLDPADGQTKSASITCGPYVSGVHTGNGHACEDGQQLQSGDYDVSVSVGGFGTGAYAVLIGTE